MSLVAEQPRRRALAARHRAVERSVRSDDERGDQPHDRSPGDRDERMQRSPRPGGPRSEAVRLTQRLRIVFAAAEGAREIGVTELSVVAIVTRSGVSRRSFYELFENREACLLATFEEGVRRAAAAVMPSYAEPRSARDSLRAGLHALLAFLDEERELGRFCVVDALGAGESVLRRRNEVLGALVSAVDRTWAESRSGPRISIVMAEGVVGAVLSILHSRLLEDPDGALAGLEQELMSIAVRPYFGTAAGEAELRRKTSSSHLTPRRGDQRRSHLRIRWTGRTIATLVAIANAPGSSNRQVSEAAGIADAGQASKLLSRLERLGLIETTAVARGTPNSWRLTPEGEEAVATLTCAAYFSAVPR